MNELAIPETNLLETPKDSDLASVLGNSKFLPRIQLAGSNTNEVKKGKVPVGTFQLIGTTTKNLGPQFNFLSIALRAKALNIPQDGTNPRAIYKRSNPEWAKIEAKANEGGMNGNMFGSEILMWIPSEETFATFFLGNPTLRRASSDLASIMLREDKETPYYAPTPATAEVVYIEGKKYQWHGAKFYQCSDPLPAARMENWQDVFIEELKKFRNPPESNVESVQDSAGSGRER